MVSHNPPPPDGGGREGVTESRDGALLTIALARPLPSGRGGVRVLVQEGPVTPTSGARPGDWEFYSAERLK